MEPIKIDVYGYDGEYLETQHLPLSIKITNTREQELWYLYNILADPREMPWSFPQGNTASFSFQTGAASINGTPINVRANLMTPHPYVKQAATDMYTRLKAIANGRGWTLVPEVGATGSDTVDFRINGHHFFVMLSMDYSIYYGFYNGRDMLPYNSINDALAAKKLI